MPDILSTVFTHPFTWGFLIAGIPALYLYCSLKIRLRALRREKETEINMLKSALAALTATTSDAATALRAENERLKAENNTLNINLHRLAAKPDRDNLLQLNIKARAVEILSTSSPGFAPCWQQAHRQAEQEQASALKGQALLNLITHPVLTFRALRNQTIIDVPVEAETNL